MPIYSFKCKRCDHKSEKGFTVAGFTAQKEQDFMFLKCGRCRRRAVLEHDFIADVRTQSSHSDEYTFSENAPEEHLVGETVSKGEAKKILKKHGLVEAGLLPKKDVNAGTRRYTEEEIVKRWAENRANAIESIDKPVDTDAIEVDTIVSTTWPGLKKQAKELGIKVPSTTKRPELERLVRESLAI
tara:strand:+ start:159 stop:713 length:555 start_codon:yes stop_codon:yes gene_type:complete